MTTIVWLRNDLRVIDNVALSQAMQQADTVVPVFIFDPNILHGPNHSPNRNRFLMQSLEDIKASLQTNGSDLVIREGEPYEVLTDIAKTTGAQNVYYSIDYSPYARKRDSSVTTALQKNGVTMHGVPGRLAIDSLRTIRTKNDKIIKVFTPFWKQWQELPRRELATISDYKPLPENIEPGLIPNLVDGSSDMLSPGALRGGATAAQNQLQHFITNNLPMYASEHNTLSADMTSKMSPYLHFGCISMRQIEVELPDTEPAAAYHRQLAWRDFYQYVLFHYPKNMSQELQERYQGMEWPGTELQLKAWQDGLTGYPIVDAAMRQLKQEGWMHNRARLIVGSFLTKDLGVDWRKGQQHFMRWLIDGDHASNNGNWQWIASVGVDPAPVFRRLYNPSTQMASHDPEGLYVKKYLPELAHVPFKLLQEPWNMSEAQQLEYGCVIGKDYPKPIVDHKIARVQALDRYRATKQN